MYYENLLYVGLYYIILVLIDSMFYGVFKENIMDGSNYGTGIFRYCFCRALFNIFEKPIRWLMTTKPFPYKKIIIPIDLNYRWALQKPLEIGLAILVFYLTGWNWFVLIGIILSHYFLAYDYGYCIILNQLYLMKQYSKNAIQPEWLMYPFQSGYWLFKPKYKFSLYTLSFIIGMILLFGLSIL